MSAASALSLNEIHVTRSTGLSLNERFTKITKNKLAQIENEKNSRRLLDRATSVANRMLLQQLQRKHKLEAALKLKRKSLRRFGSSAGQIIRRGTVKALRVGAHGKPIRMNSLANIATMKADHEVTNGRRSMRRSNSSSSLTGRLGPRRPSVGGAAERVARRRLQRQAAPRGGRSELYMNNENITTASENRRRSRSRSRIRGSVRIQKVRGRSRSIGQNNNKNNSNLNNDRHSRSRTPNRPSPARNNIPIKARLGVRTGTLRNGGNNNNNIKMNNNNANKSRNRRNASLTRRGVIRGRIQKTESENIVQQNIAGAMRGRGRNGRRRGRSAVRNMLKNGNVLRGRSRSRSRARKNQGQVGQLIQKQQRPSTMTEKQHQQQNKRRRHRRARGRNQQRRSNSAKRTTNNNTQNSHIGKQQQQQRQSRARSRSRNRFNRGNNSQANQIPINKDELDKELDQYMATTKTENNVDFLLKH